MKMREPLAILTILALQSPLCRANIELSASLADDQNHKSVCQQYHKVNVTQQVSYMETYNKRRPYDEYGDYGYVVGTRVNFRTEIVSKWKMVEMCCEGYVPHELAENTEECVPVCPSGCKNGTCHRPKVCTCDPGYGVSVHVLTGYSECSPECESGCVGGTCVAPNTCECSTGYTLANNGASCEPTCHDVDAGGPQGCGEHAICLLPNTCQCHDGWVPDTRFKYLGIDAGTSYASTTNFENTTMQKPTFHTNDMKCMPECEGGCHESTFCTAPNVCECRLNYQPDPLNETQCLPICLSNCFNGYCQQPYQCACHDGYRPYNVLKADFCEAICQDDCVNGKCTSPNHCECLDGYEKLVVRNGNSSETSANVCIPVCLGHCPNGSCIAPGRCHCNPGYVLASSNITNETTEIWTLTLSDLLNDKDSINFSRQTCVPFCEPRCDNRSICIAPNQCEYQTWRGNDYTGYPIDRTRIVETPNDCGIDGVYFEENNGSCGCNYHSNDKTRIESILCGVIIINDTESAGQFDALERVVFLETAYNGTNRRNNETELEKSAKECRISVLSYEIPNDLRGKSVNCYQLELHNATTGLLSIELGGSPPIPVGNNESLLCFVNSKFGCNAKELGALNGQIDGLIGGAVGAIVLIVIVVALGLSVYYLLTRRKISQRNETIMERSEATDSPFHTDDSSHL